MIVIILLYDSYVHLGIDYSGSVHSQRGRVALAVVELPLFMGWALDVRGLFHNLLLLFQKVKCACWF